MIGMPAREKCHRCGKDGTRLEWKTYPCDSYWLCKCNHCGAVWHERVVYVWKEGDK
jgi:late competence protein required for DNA uptake (superfamily II DNA/RNA helicase)